MEKIYRILIQRMFTKMQPEFIIGMTDNNTIAYTQYIINTKYINLIVVVFCQNNSPHQKMSRLAQIQTLLVPADTNRLPVTVQPLPHN